VHVSAGALSKPLKEITKLIKREAALLAARRRSCARPRHRAAFYKTFRKYRMRELAARQLIQNPYLHGA
jgi:hypothetical protein